MAIVEEARKDREIEIVPESSEGYGIIDYIEDYCKREVLCTCKIFETPDVHDNTYIEDLSVCESR
jgi:hypothetical protein